MDDTAPVRPGLDAPSPAAWSSKLRNWAEAQQIHRYEDTLLLVLTLLIGAIVGLVVVAFILVTERLSARLGLTDGPGWRRLAVPTAGALVSGLLLVRLFPNARGSGIPQTKTALLLRDGFISLRTVVGKFVCSSLSLASGIALGREGPTVHVGAGIASVLGRRVGLSPRRVQALVPIGTAAALAAAFNTPISAVLFTLEEILADLHAPVLGSIVISAATSWAVLHLVLGDEPLFHVPAYQLVHPAELPIYAVLGIAGGLVAVAFVKLLLGLRRRFLALPTSTKWAQPAVGGLVVGALGWVVPGVLGVGYGYVGDALNGHLVLQTMALFLALKIVATATCYASGNAGGIFGPSLFIGAMLGGSVGSVAHGLLPDTTGSPGAYALVGMGTAFAGIVRAPMTSVIMIFEITRDYSIIVPLMIANLLSFFISQRLQPRPVYEALLDQDDIRLPTARPQITRATVAQAMRRPASTLAGSSAAADVLSALEDRNADRWLPVVEGDRLLGMVDVETIRHACGTGSGARRLSELVAGSRESTPGSDVPYVHVDQTVDVVLQRMGTAGVRILPVVSRTDPRELLGVIALDDMPAAYATDSTLPRPAESRRTVTPATTLLTVVVVGVCGLFLVGILLTNHYYAQRIETATQAYRAGVSLVEQGRDAEAVERFRTALSLDRRQEYRLALGLSLARAGRSAEATTYLTEYLSADPQNGPARMALARVAAGSGDAASGAAGCRQAIAGRWPTPALARRNAAFECADMLHTAGDTRGATGVLLAIADREADVPTLERVGRELLALGAAEQAADVFAQAVSDAPNDPAAHAGLGQAAMARGDYRQARTSYRNAARLAPTEPSYAARADVAEHVLSLDPRLPGLSRRERYSRSRLLLEAIVPVGRACASPQAAIDEAMQQLVASRVPHSYAEATEDLLQTAVSLWAQIPTQCPDRRTREAVVRVMERLSD